MFTSRQARRTAARFRRKGLKGSAMDLVRGIEGAAARGSSVLEVGGGVGQIQVALLQSGVAESAINVELSSSWEGAAAGLLAERRLVDRVQRIQGDFVDRAATLPKADVVVLHRVLCCYPDWKAMLTAAIGNSNEVVALTFPNDRWWTRWGIRIGNMMCRVSGRSFRGFVHSPGPMISLLQRSGFAIVSEVPGTVWRTVIARARQRGRSLPS